VNTAAGFHVEINFYGRFDIEDTFACANDYLQVNSAKSSVREPKRGSGKVFKIKGYNIFVAAKIGEGSLGLNFV